MVGRSFQINGQSRPRLESGHEHFGFEDGVSQPAVIDEHPKPLEGEPAAIKPGVLLLGRDGDIDLQGNPIRRPTWAIDSSFLVFRQLNQLVPEFDKFLTDHALTKFGLDVQHGRDLLGARLFGRWKSGAPVELTPTHDDPRLAQNNSFEFDESSKQDRCPYAAHIRKTNPRNDPNAFPGAVEQRRRMRTGIPFGPEVSPSEVINQPTEHERGLAFVCYQSNIVQRFKFMQEVGAMTQGSGPRRLPQVLTPLSGRKGGSRGKWWA